MQFCASPWEKWRYHKFRFTATEFTELGGGSKLQSRIRRERMEKSSLPWILKWLLQVALMIDQDVAMIW